MATSSRLRVHPVSGYRLSIGQRRKSMSRSLGSSKDGRRVANSPMWCILSVAQGKDFAPKVKKKRYCTRTRLPVFTSGHGKANQTSRDTADRVGRSAGTVHPAGTDAGRYTGLHGSGLDRLHAL